MDKNALKRLIIPYTRDGEWECDYDLRGVIRFIRQQEEDCGAIDLDPDFQRGHVWTSAQQEAWLIHILRGGKSGRRIFFNHPGWKSGYNGIMELIDGKQRIEAIRAFLNNEVTLWGYTYKELCPDATTARLVMRHCTIKINVNTLKTREEVLHWYLEMNDGGTPHTEAELQKVRDMLRAERTWN